MKAPWEESGDNNDMNGYEVAITGKAFELMMERINSIYIDDKSKELYRDVIAFAKVYARMSPDNKAMLVTQLQENSKYMIGMCGDGANDWKALKVADAGLSLSEAEASIAAPFTSKIPNISPMIKLLREGRTAIVTSFQMFKFMALYSMIQFTSVILLYFIGNNLGDWQYLYIDLFVIIPLSLTMARTGAHSKLSKIMPIGKLISFINLFSVMGQILLQAGFQIILYFFLKRQHWFVPWIIEEEESIVSYENTTIFLFSWTLYLIVVISFSVGRPFRKPMWTNIFLVLWMIIFGSLTYLMILVPPRWVRRTMQLKVISLEWAGIIWAFSGGFLIWSYILEKLQGWIRTILSR